VISGHKGVSWSLHPILRSVALERILVSGGERWTEPVAVKLPAPLHDKVIRDARVFTGLDDGGRWPRSPSSCMRTTRLASGGCLSRCGMQGSAKLARSDCPR
jgi:hypothetical protein